ncbi:MAG: alkaline phosphatase family protein [Deltaproteobacteria bacterium]|nr:MAG: alkaline phosphatase family protein [Deltaproteobacteria bacterium]
MLRPLVLALLLVAGPLGAESPPPCPFGPGDLPAVTLPPGTLHGAQIPIDNVVVIMQENRAFDHYLGQLHREGQPQAEAEPKNASNPDPTSPNGRPITAFHQTRYCECADLDHSWNGTHREWDNGAMDGFTAANVDPCDPTGSRTMGFYDKRDLPFYYGLYKTFAIGDRFFCSTLTQTFPNRFYLLAGTSFGHIQNDLPSSPTEFSQRTIFNLLDEAVPPVTWKVYFSQVAFADIFAYVRNTRQVNVVPIDQYFSDAAAGTLPQVSFVDPIFLGPKNVENDEHPPANIQVGQEFVSRVVRALLASPQWPRAALFLTYDEHGGFFDHVPPPPACVPDGIPPMLEASDVPGAFDRYGIRVPAAVVSPFSRPHSVSHTPHDHTSILRFIETRFDLPALTARDANADPMLEFFDFTGPQLLKPPSLPAATIDPAHFAECASG